MTRNRPPDVREFLHLIAIVFAVFAISACRESLRDKLDFCVIQAMQSPGHIIDCDLQRSVWVVGRPSKALTSEQMKAAGVPEAVALGWARDDIGTSKWCVVEELPRAEAPPGARNDSELYRQFRSECASANVEIHALVVAHGQRFVVTVNDGVVAVTGQ